MKNKINLNEINKVNIIPELRADREYKDIIKILKTLVDNQNLNSMSLYKILDALRKKAMGMGKIPMGMGTLIKRIEIAQAQNWIEIPDKRGARKAKQINITQKGLSELHQIDEINIEKYNEILFGIVIKKSPLLKNTKYHEPFRNIIDDIGIEHGRIIGKLKKRLQEYMELSKKIETLENQYGTSINNLVEILLRKKAIIIVKNRTKNNEVLLKAFQEDFEEEINNITIEKYERMFEEEKKEVHTCFDQLIDVYYELNTLLQNLEKI